jgi:hypothetical protein
LFGWLVGWLEYRCMLGNKEFLSHWPLKCIYIIHKN